jgi:ribose transport system permease protein
MIEGREKILRFLMRQSSILLVLAVFAFFGFLSPAFLGPRNLLNILIQSSSVAIVAIGMTFVLLTGGIDLSVGSIMLVSAAVAGKLVLAGMPLGTALCAILGVGLLYGMLNAFCVTRLKVLPFVVTLATLYIGRGLGLWITQTRAMNLPDNMLQLGTARILGLPFPVIAFLSVLVCAHAFLQRTAFGRQIYAIGNSQEFAEKAGIRVQRTIGLVYVISGVCAALGGLVSVAQLGAVSPTFGNQREFAAVAAAVLGGTSLFGGRGGVFPGTVLGAVLIQTVENGLVIINADPYLYPMVMSLIIFLAVLVDSIRYGEVLKHRQRFIRAKQA